MTDELRPPQYAEGQEVYIKSLDLIGNIVKRRNNDEEIYEVAINYFADASDLSSTDHLPEPEERKITQRRLHVSQRLVRLLESPTVSADAIGSILKDYYSERGG